MHADVVSHGSLPIWVLPIVLLLCLLITGAASVLWILNRSATLTVITNGSGTISSSPEGISNCNATCSSKFGHNANVALVAAPISPSTFGGWSGGGCSGTLLTCDLKLSDDQTVTAIFNPPGSQTLIVNISGTGKVASQPTGINCSATNCSFAFPENTPVTLTANPTGSSTFGGWTGGGCSGNELACTVTMNALQSVTAIFNPPGKKTLTVNIVGTGNVTSSPPGIQNCGGPVCTFDFEDNTSVTLIAAPTSPSTFGGWGGACSSSGTSTTCTVSMNQAQTLIATFNSPANKSLTVTKSGSGTVTSSPSGIICDPTCTFDFADNTPVTLTASAIPPFTFGGWRGACSSFGIAATCSVTMNQAQNVTAIFNAPSNQTVTTTTTLNPIPTTLTAGQTNVAFSGLVSGNPAAPNGQVIQLQIRSGGCGSDGFSTMASALTTNGSGSFSSIFTAPSSAGTYGFRASFPQTGNIGGNTWQLSNSACQTIIVDAINNQPPDTSLTSQPSNLSNSSSATFNFFGTSSGGGTLTYECKLDTGNFEVCNSPKTYQNLPDGAHTFQVRARDAIGNVDPSPENFPWTIDATGPNVTINKADTQADPVTGMQELNPISFTVVFSESVQDFTDADVTLGGSWKEAIDQVEVTGSGTTYTVKLFTKISDLRACEAADDCMVSASINAGAVTDALGNLSFASNSTDNIVKIGGQP